ncbi:barstar family protein [Neobacillus sp. PS2-9]|uniref:barstar family protein n=1 Tax=Neobacillus sp. PS2-9 TaxID=3070676 RepID=UPI0027DF3BE0|nr:barstar family protein [Neobacillus sp. PS2-9]WML56078.1 barstar family protein [Neobacillus sp. PS2-9]
MSIERNSIVTIDVTNIKTTKELHTLLKERLDFPDFYGENWDAFWDVITGLIELPTIVQFIGWSYLEKNLPTDAEVLLECLNEYNKEYPDEKTEFFFNNGG